MSTIKKADKIIGFKNGEKVEEGDNDSLLKIVDGVYKTLSNMQTYVDDDNEDEKTERRNHSKLFPKMMLLRK